MVVKLSPFGIPLCGMTVSSPPFRSHSAAPPRTLIDSTVSPTKSRLNCERFCFARALIVAFPVSTSVAGSYVISSR